MSDTTTRSRQTPAYVWGYNNTGGLGLGHAARAYEPVPTALPGDVADLQGGVEFTVALTAGGDVYTWGGNQVGQLGTSGLRNRRTPDRVDLPGHAKARAIAAGTDHVLVLTRDRELLVWGGNHWGQLGDGTATDRFEPLRLHSRPISSIAAGNSVSAAVTTDGELLTWGRNTRGQLAQPGHQQEVHKPVAAQLPKGTRIRAVDAGRHHLVVVTEPGRVLMFGSDGFGRPAPARLELKSAWGRVRAISAGDEFTLALTDRHVLLAWGQNGNGQLGHGDTLSRVHPAVVRLPRAEGHPTQIFAGARSATVLTSAHEVYTWGDTRMGQGGHGLAIADQQTPKKVRGIRGRHVHDLYGGAHHTVVTATPGPAVALRLTPSVTTTRPGQAVTYSISEVDAFGVDLGPTKHRVNVHISDGDVLGRTVRATTPGSHRVIVLAGRLRGTATLIVKKEK